MHRHRFEVLILIPPNIIIICNNTTVVFTPSKFHSFACILLLKYRWEIKFEVKVVLRKKKKKKEYVPKPLIMIFHSNL